MSISNMQPWLPRVVIVGAGFGGLAAAKALKGAPLGVTIIDRRNYDRFQPLLYHGDREPQGSGRCHPGLRP